MQKRLNFWVLIILVCLFPLSSAWSGKSPKDETVFIEKYGEKVYHREWCPSLKLYKKRTTVGKATAQGYVPCKHCKPPVVLSNVSASGSTQKTVKSIKLVRPSIPLAPHKNPVNHSLNSRKFGSTNCPAQYFNGSKISSADIDQVADFIRREGKVKIISELHRHKSILTIRQNDVFRQMNGRPAPRFVDECTIMYDLKSVNMTPLEFESKVYEHDKYLTSLEEGIEADRKREIERQHEAERLAQLEAERAEQKRIADERQAALESKRLEAETHLRVQKLLQQGRLEAKQQAEFEARMKRLDEAREATAKDAAATYRVFGRVDPEFVKDCHDSIHLVAKNQAKIVSAIVFVGSDKLILRGKAKLQNGYGAWTNYSYSCIDSIDPAGSMNRTSADLLKGWRDAISAENVGGKVLDLE